jgi:uncharacterized RDD family membrane protein YckC
VHLYGNYDVTTIDQPLQQVSDMARYARFSRRLQAMFIDWAITLVVIFGALTIASSRRHDDLSFFLGVAVVVILVLYEPVLVSRTGGTIGHHLTNLRVVDDATGGNVSFLKAAARVVVKGVLGLYSCLSMAFTRRNQAVHDFVTRSTVQIRDLAKASPGQYITERTRVARPDMPSVARRIVVTLAYLLVTAVVYLGLEQWAVQSDAISMHCLDTDVCTTTENVLTWVLGGGTLITLVACVVLGWLAKLPGARSA